MELVNLLKSGIGPKSNGVITKEEMLYIFLGFNTEENQEDDKLVILKLDASSAYVSKLIDVDKLNEETVETNLEVSEYTSLEDLSMTENFIMFSMLKAFEQAINTSVDPDRPFADTIIPALLDILHLAADKIRDTEEGIKELAVLAEMDKTNDKLDEGFDLMLHTLGIQN